MIVILFLVFAISILIGILVWYSEKGKMMSEKLVTNLLLAISLLIGILFWYVGRD
jgi:hypothetical protein